MSNDAKKQEMKNYFDSLTKRTPTSHGLFYFDSQIEGIPISHGIFESGFYCDGRYITYRMSFWETLLSYVPSKIALFASIFFEFVQIMLFLFLINFKLYNIALSMFVICMAMKYDTFSLSLFPKCRFDIDKKIVRYGWFFIKNINFSDVNSLSVYKYRIKAVGGGFCTDVCLDYEKPSHNYITRIARFHIWEEVYVDAYIEMIKLIVCKPIVINRINHNRP
jgi:hypothetical protein